MFQQPSDFLDETDALHALLEPLSDADFERTTQFKDWSIHDVIAHLHLWNTAADLALRDADAFRAFSRELLAGMQKGRTMVFHRSGAVAKISKDPKMEGNLDCGEYVGVFAVSKKNAYQLREAVSRLRAAGDLDRYPSPSYLFQRFIEEGLELHAVSVDRQDYAVCDYPEDLEQARVKFCG